MTLINSDDLEKTTAFLLRGFAQWYVRKGFNFEIGLTGSKMEAVAAAAISSICKVTQCWYVRPTKFDAARFTKGAGATRYFRLTLNGGGSAPTPPAPRAAPQKPKYAEESAAAFRD